ncbi:MAG: sigma-54-dependent Fis family transcriptional regulator [Deltaproteobacteria bacterium]|nr:MAG: sigma-54-dependent Fis family transcriptional regulator [Deltaproteobacteria bacterium]
MDSRPVILVVDDDLGARESLGIILEDEYEVLKAESGERALEILSEQAVNVVLLDVKMPGLDGIETLKRIKEKDESVEVIMVSGLNILKKAVDAIKLGAYDYILKPFDPEEILTAVERALERQRMSRELSYFRLEREQLWGASEIVSQDEKMKEVFDIIQKVAYTTTTVLIVGESGTGKELVARAIHRAGPRREKPFVAINCASIPAELMESELFGYEKGAFTGAYAQTIGKFEYADGGTLFLDEISTLKPELQAKLLRVIEEKRIQRIGSARPIPVDVRIIAATNMDLKKMVEEGKFRQDLYFRLNVLPIQLPPLRERKDDIPLLLDYFVKKFNEKYRRKVKGFSPEAVEALKQYQWPGNVRELENLVERMVVLSDGEKTTTLSDLPVEVLVGKDELEEIPVAELGLIKAREEFERRLISKVLELTGGNQSETARILKIHRNTLLQKMEQLGLKKKRNASKRS